MIQKTCTRQSTYLFLITGFVFLLPLSMFFLGGCAGTPAPEKETEEEEVPSKEKSKEIEEEEGPTLYEQIAVYIEDGEIDKALMLLREKDNPGLREEEDFVLLYGSLLFITGEYSEARSVLEEAKKRFSDNTEVLYTLSLLEGITGNREKERELLEEVISFNPEHDLARTSLGLIYLEERKFTRAQKEFETLLKRDPNDIKARRGLGKTLLHRKMYKQAVKEFTKVLEAEPESPMIYSDRSRAYLGLEDFASAEKDLDRAIEFAPDNFWHYLDRGKVRLYRGKEDFALKDFNKAIELDPSNFFPYAYRGEIYFYQGNHKQALEDFRKVLSARKDFTPAFPPMGALRYMKQQWAAAASYFKRAYENNKQDETLALLAALSYVKGEKKDQAEKILSSIHSTAKKESALYYMSRYILDKRFETRAIEAVKKEESSLLKHRFMYIIGAISAHNDKKRVARAYFMEVMENIQKQSVEYVLAKHELEQLNLSQ